MATVINLGEFNIANVDRLQATIHKDGVAWTGIDSVTLVFEKPDRSTQFSRSMTVSDDSTGVWYYDTTTTDFDTAGFWTVTLTVVDGSITKKYPYEIGFHVNDEP